MQDNGDKSNKFNSKIIEIILSNFIKKATRLRNHYNSPAELRGSAEHSLVTTTPSYPSITK